MSIDVRKVLESSKDDGYKPRTFYQEILDGPYTDKDIYYIIRDIVQAGIDKADGGIKMKENYSIKIDGHVYDHTKGPQEIVKLKGLQGISYSNCKEYKKGKIGKTGYAGTIICDPETRVQLEDGCDIRVAIDATGTTYELDVRGLKIINEGSGGSIDDTSLEIQMTYVADYISGWFPVK